MAMLDFGIKGYDPAVAQKQGFNYAQQIQEAAQKNQTQQAQQQAGSAYANGDLTGAADTLARSGDIKSAETIRSGQTEKAKAAQEYLGKSIAIFQKIAADHANDPDGGVQAIGQQFDKITPEMAAVTGASPQQVQMVRQGLLSDPQGYLANAKAHSPVKYHVVGRDLIKEQGDTFTPVYQGQKDAPANYQWAPDGKSLQAIPGGGADPEVVKKLGETRREVIINNPVPGAGGGGVDEPLSDDAVGHQVGMYLASRGAILPQFGYGKVGVQNRNKFYNSLGKQMDAGGITDSDIASGRAEYKANSSALGQVSKMRNSVESYEKTVLDNMKIIESNLDKGARNGPPIFNRWVQAGRNALQGDPDVTAYNTAIQTVANEYAKVMAGGTGSSAASSDSARAEAHSLINNAQTPAQIKAALSTMRQEMANRINSLRGQETDLKTRLGNKSGGSDLKSKYGLE
jgi:hypothetical protein